MTYGTIVKCGPKSKTPGRWGKVLCLSPDGKRAWIAVFPEGHVKPNEPKYR
jgi:hypothetical protein